MLPRERARRCREMAEEAFQVSAEASSLERRRAYLKLAAAWHRLATDLEGENEPDPDDLPLREQVLP